MARPRWQNAFGQLLSFLALSKTVDAKHRLNLIVYIAVLFYSGAIAVYYLFIHAKTHVGS